MSIKADQRFKIRTVESLLLNLVHTVIISWSNRFTKEDEENPVDKSIIESLIKFKLDHIRELTERLRLEDSQTRKTELIKVFIYCITVNDRIVETFKVLEIHGIFRDLVTSPSLFVQLCMAR